MTLHWLESNEGSHLLRANAISLSDRRKASFHVPLGLLQTVGDENGDVEDMLITFDTSFERGPFVQVSRLCLCSLLRQLIINDYNDELIHTLELSQTVEGSAHRT